MHCGERLQAGRDRAPDDLAQILGERARVAAGQHACVREDKVARNAEHRRVADRVDQLARRVERRVRLRREHDEVGALNDLLVAPTLDAELDRPLLAALGVARADVDVLAERAEPARQRAPEGTGPADDRDLHTGTASTASASRRRAAASLISVCVTIVGIPASSSASALSTTSASIRPL